MPTRLHHLIHALATASVFLSFCATSQAGDTTSDPSSSEIAAIFNESKKEISSPAARFLGARAINKQTVELTFDIQDARGALNGKTLAEFNAMLEKKQGAKQAFIDSRAKAICPNFPAMIALTDLKLVYLVKGQPVAASVLLTRATCQPYW